MAIDPSIMTDHQRASNDKTALRFVSVVIVQNAPITAWKQELEHQQ